MDMDQGVLYILGALAARFQIVSLLLDIYNGNGWGDKRLHAFLGDE
jgi:hypothetical protein